MERKKLSVRQFKCRNRFFGLLLFCLCMCTYAQNGIRINGKVTDGNGEDLIGVTVKVKGSSTGTITDIDGNYAITVPGTSSVLQFSYVGYIPREIVASKREINVVMKEDSELLDEVVVVGYGIQKKASLTSAISQIKGEEVFKDRGISNVTVALQGEIPGLVVTRGSTRPGSEGAAMKIRGDISVNGNSSPLVLIDGLAGSLDELNQMEPNDIENISLLKDASAAIYGARSASGVMLVTTKRGKKGAAQITYNGSLSTTIDGIQMPLSTNEQWLDMFYEAQYNDAIANNKPEDLINSSTGQIDPSKVRDRINWWVFGSVLSGADESGKPYVNGDLWQALRNGETLTLNKDGLIHRYEPGHYLIDELYGRSVSTKHSVNISGADDKFGYMASLGFADNQSQLKIAEDGEKKYSGRLNMDYQATKILKLEVGMSYEKRNITTPSTAVGDGWMDQWFWPVRNEAGNYYDTFDKRRNPVGAVANGGQVKTNWTTFRSNVKATFDLSILTEGLSVSGTGGYKSVGKDIQSLYQTVQFYDWANNKTGVFNNSNNNPGRLNEELNKWESLTLGGFANYERRFNGVHNVSAMLGMSAEEENWKKVFASRRSGPLYAGSGLVDLDAMQTGTNNEASGGQSSWAFLSYITRLNYNYADKYLLEFLGRRDGSSKLALNQRWKNFYAVSGGWIISNEDFMKDFHWLNNLKIRYNYGKTGSVEGIGNYERYALISTGTAIFGLSPAAQPSLWLSGMTSNDRTWETIVSHDAGLDFAFLNGRLSGSFDYFSKTNEGMFIPVTYPAILGASAPKTNNGKFGAKGWELSLNWRDKIGSLRYNIGGFIADASAKVLELENNENVPQPGKNSNRLIGMPREAIYVYQTDGIFQTQAEADAYYDTYYWNADRTGPKSGNILPTPAATGLNRLRAGARKLVDTDKDGAITEKDLVYAGDAAPHLTFGFKAGLEWKGIDLQAFFQGVGKQVVLRTGNLTAPWVTNYTAQNNSYIGKTWTEDNPNAEYTIMSRDNNFNRFNYWNKDVSVQKSQYVRLKSLIIGYTLPGQLTAKVALNKVRIYFSGDDLWEATRIKDGYDPEYGEGSNNTFPFSRLVSVGLDITF